MLEDGFYFINSDNSYTKFAARLLRITEYAQNPLKPNELQFEADSSVPINPYAEIVYVKNHLHVFHGDVVDRGDSQGKWVCKCKAAWWRWDWRYIPDYIYHGCTVGEMLTDECPSVALGAKDISSEALSANIVYLTLYTATKSFSLTDLYIYSSGGSSVKFAIYANNSGAIGSQLKVQNTSQTVVAGWNRLSFASALSITKGTSYWIAAKSSGAILGKKTITATSKYYSDSYSNNMPTSFSSPTAATTYRLMAYALPRKHVGLLAWIHSIIPNGIWTAHNSTTIKLADAGTKSAIGSNTLFASTNCPTGTACDGCDGIHILSSGSGKDSLSADEYYRDANDLYVRMGPGTYGPNAYFVGSENWADDKIRIGDIECEALTCAIDQSWRGLAAKQLSDFAEKAGMEAGFTPWHDGTVRYSLATTIGRGTEAAPIWTFRHGWNCKIEMSKKTEPDIQVAIGLNEDDSPDLAVSDWSVVNPQMFKTYDGKGQLKEELEEHLQGILDKNADSYKVVTGDLDYFLPVGSWVRLIHPTYGTFSLRVQKKDIYNHLMTLDCGKALFDAAAAFGEYLRPSVDAAQTALQTKTLTSGSGTFTAKATDVAAGGWKCYYEHSYTAASDGSALSTNPFIVVTIGGAIIPPGRIPISDGSIKIDITDYCGASAVTDTTITVATTLYNSTGWTSSKCEIKQYKGRRFLE